MKILMFSADSNILDRKSSAAKRMSEYAKRAGRLDIIVLARKIPKEIPKDFLRENQAGSFNPHVRNGILLRFLTGFFLAWRLIKKEKYDLLVAQDIEHAKICWLLSFRFRVPWQMQIHTDIFSPYFIRHSVFNKMRSMLAKFLIPRASCIRVVSERIKKSILQLRTSDVRTDIGCPYIDVLPILISPADTNVEPKIFPEFNKTILMVSRLASEKNIGLAIEAMAEIVKKYPKTGLVIVGDGPERLALKLQITNYKLQNNIRFEGWQSNTASYYKCADIFLLTSWYEGWGMSAVDAMRYGVAVIMADVGLAGELVEDGKTGLVVPVGDKNALTAAILRLLENETFGRDLVEEATKKVKELPSGEEYYQKIIDCWQKCQTSNV